LLKPATDIRGLHIEDIEEEGRGAIEFHDGIDKVVVNVTFNKNCEARDTRSRT
jgi:hypothetical protein